MATRSISLLIAMLGILMSTAWAQDPDPSMSIDSVKTQAQALEAEKALPAFADKWMALVDAKDKAAAEAAQGYDSDNADRSAISKTITELESERNSLQLRLEAVISVLRAQKNDAKAGELEGRLSAMKTTHVDLTDPSALWNKAKAWVLDPEGGIRIGLNILSFIIIIIVAKILANIASRILSKTLSASKLNISALLKDFFVNTTRKVIFFCGLVMAVGKIGIDTGPLLAGIGVAGFVIGFALQGTLSNFASGIMILLYRPYDVGDVVSAAGATGKVTDMSLVSTTLTTPDNQIVIIPNSSIWGGVITNITGNSTRRVDMTFGIGYDDDIPKAMAILEEIVTSHEKVLKEPKVAIQLHELADSSVNFIVRPWANTGDYWAVYWDTQRAVKERFDAEGISIPYPQQDVHVHQVEAS